MRRGAREAPNHPGRLALPEKGATGGHAPRDVIDLIPVEGDLTRRGLIAGSAAAGVVAALPGTAGAAAKRKPKRCAPVKRKPASTAVPAPEGPIGTRGRVTPLPELARIAGEENAGERALCLLDLAAFDANWDNVFGFATAQGWAVRPALKSFQSAAFAAYALGKLPQPRGMVFHLATVDPILAAAPPNTDLLMGYPPSLAELRAFLATPAPATPHRLRILVDSIELLTELARLARDARRPLPLEVALQLESGFFLSGFDTPEALREALAILRRERERLKLTAVVVYDGHAAFNGAKPFRQAVVADTQRRWAAWMAQLAAEGSDLYDARTLVRNGPASSTYRLWAGSPLPSEVTPGAALFFHGYITGDGYENQTLVPTIHHAAAVHRISSPARVPITGAPQSGDSEAVATKGGAWPTSSGTPDAVVFPTGLEPDDLHGGRGNNQAHYLAPKGALRRGDYVISRPKHAGDAFDHFDEILAIREGRVVRRWKTISRPG